MYSRSAFGFLRHALNQPPKDVEHITDSIFKPKEIGGRSILFPYYMLNYIILPWSVPLLISITIVWLHWLVLPNRRIFPGNISLNIYVGCHF